MYWGSPPAQHKFGVSTRRLQQLASAFSSTNPHTTAAVCLSDKMGSGRYEEKNVGGSNWSSAYAPPPSTTTPTIPLPQTPFPPPAFQACCVCFNAVITSVAGFN